MTPADLKPSLLPCPFCGSSDLEEDSECHGHGDYSPSIECKSCSAKISPYSESHIKAWNTRAKPLLPSVKDLANVTTDLVEEYFPKGECQERGKAIVLHAKMLITIVDYLEGK